MARVKGLGGVFFRTSDPAASREWYSKHLGIKSNQYGGTFEWRAAESPDKKGFTAWSPFDSKTDYMDPSKKDVMINYRVENLPELLKQLAEEGVTLIGEMETYDYGKFAWIMDPDGYKIELWEPNDTEYEKLADNANKSS